MKKSLKYTIIGAAILSLIGLGGFGLNLSKPKAVNVQASFDKIRTIEEATNEAENVIIGKVIKNEVAYNYVYGEPYPWTDSIVHIEKSFKGNLKGNIVFAQEGGLDKETNTMILLENYNVLTPEQQYVFFIRKAYIFDGHTEMENKYVSVGGPTTVYRIEGAKAKNVIMPELNKDFSEIEQIITKKIKNK
ncbi:MAG: hypothetical protein WA131_02620 [Desulfitobacteriaceae bacterium]